MDKRTSDALEASIEKWKRNQQLVENTIPGEDINMPLTRDDCALCQEFPSCTGCPVMERTGHSACRGSPYWVVYDRVQNYYWEKSKNNLARLEEAVDDEVKFLEGLRPQLT